MASSRVFAQASLTATLRESSTRFVRCIKTNHFKRPRDFDDELVRRQLVYSGVFEAVTIRKQGYPFRVWSLLEMAHEDIIEAMDAESVFGACDGL